MSWNDSPPTKEELAGTQTSWADSAPTSDELKQVSGTQDSSTSSHAFLNALSNPFGIEPAVQGGLEASGKAISDLVNKGSISIDDIKKKYQEARDAEKQANDTTANAHPIANFAGDLAGGVMVGGALPLPEAAEGAKFGARALNAAKIGAGYGAATGLGQSISSGSDLPTTAKNVGFGAGAGAIAGPVVEGGISSLKGLGSEIADTDTYQKFMKSLGYGLDKTNLTSKAGAQQAQEGVENAAEALGFGARDANKSTGAQVGAAKQALSDSDRTYDISDKIDKIKTAISNLRESSNPNADKDADFLQKYLDNLTLGKEQQVPYSTLSYNKGIPSAEDKIAGKLSSLQAKEAAVPKGISGNVVESEDEAGNPFLNLVKEKAAEEGEAPVRNVSYNLPKTEGQEASVIQGNQTSKTVRPGGIDPTAVDFDTANDINKSLTDFGGVSGNGPELKTTDALNATKLAGQGLKQQLTGAIHEGAEGPMSQLGAANQKASASYKALNALGIDDASFETNPLTGEKVLTPQGEAKLANTVRQIGRGTDTQSGQNATNRLDTALEYLKAVDPEKAAAIEQQVKKSGEIYNLVQQGQGNQFTKSGFLKSLPVQAGNRIGRLASGPVDTIQGVVNGAKNVASAVGKEVSSAIQPLTDTAFGTAAKELVAKGTGVSMKLGSELAKAIGKDNSQKNAILFSLMQQPAYREELQSHFGNGTEGQ